VVKNEKINEIERTRVRSPPRATSLKKNWDKQDTYMYLVFSELCDKPSSVDTFPDMATKRKAFWCPSYF
jgi:hypothetical protein